MKNSTDEEGTSRDLPLQGPGAPCTWCYHGQRRMWVRAEHVALFACVHEHMTARPLCAECADGALGGLYYCSDCADAGESEDYAVCQITLVTTREDWMEQIHDGRIRMAVRP